MKVRRLLYAVFGCVLVGSVAGAAQERGDWRAASSSAKTITGDVGFSGEKIVINFSGFTIAQIRRLKPEEIGATFNAEADAAGSGNLYRLSIPPEKRFLHKNTLCGSEETQWVATYVMGKSLQLVFFSGASMPVLTPEAMANQTSLCGTFSYVR